MANISCWLEKAYLDWCLLGAGAPTRPPAIHLGLAVGTPTSIASANAAAGSEMGVATGYTRMTVTFGAANSPAGTASNNNYVSFGPFSSNGSAIGCHLWDAQAVGSSNCLWYGTLLNPRTFIPNDTLIVAPGALIVTLS
jgi:hypothetical protein